MFYQKKEKSFNHPRCQIMNLYLFFFSHHKYEKEEKFGWKEETKDIFVRPREHKMLYNIYNVLPICVVHYARTNIFNSYHKWLRVLPSQT